MHVSKLGFLTSTPYLRQHSPSGICCSYLEGRTAYDPMKPCAWHWQGRKMGLVMTKAGMLAFQCHHYALRVHILTSMDEDGH
eukprot:1561477-Ditylum_brightwellii.AAC.1